MSSEENIRMKSGPLEYTFTPGGMLGSITLPGTLGNADLLAAPSVLKIALAGGRELFTVPGKTEPERWVSARTGAVLLEYADLAFADRTGAAQPGLRMTLRYELFDDGTAFCDAFFLGEQITEEISGFELSLPLSFDAFETVRWSLAYRPKKIDGTLIQTSAPERALPPGEDRVLDHSILPLTGFNLWQKSGPSCYAEFVMEGDNVLAGDPACNRSSVLWKNGNPILTWNFQTSPVRPKSGPWQWRNRWGWVVAPAAQTRHFPPLAMYHYFDNTRRYPDDETLEMIARSKADVLILHENWRTDVQNGGQPYDPEKFRHVIDFAHRHGIRVMVYIRGSEDSVVEEQADWFDKYLERDRDGLYMDYGGPFHGQTPPNESFHGGRIHFRRHYLANRRLRGIAGPEGLFFSHTGPMFSALGMTAGTIDGYVSGEGERGLLIRSRLDHAYYSMATVCPGTMWTAAFPEYSSPAMIPFLASAGQSPHVPLGVQFASSSLAHPPVPGPGDANFRPLWKLWHLLRGKKDLRVFSDYNSSGIFPRSPEVSRYLMIADDRAVCIFANLSGRAVAVDPAIDKAAAGIPESWPGRLCLPDVTSPGRALPFGGEAFTLAPSGIAAVVFGEADFSAYEEAYPELSPEGREYLACVEEQRRFRCGTGAAPEWFLRLSIADMPVPYDESMTVDLYDNRFELCEVENGALRRIGFLGKNGFRKEETPREEFLMAGERSCWIPLRTHLGPGLRHLAIRSLHRGDLFYMNTPFYSFIEVEVSRAPERGAEYTISFMNDLENDRSLLHFDLTFEA